MAGPFLECLTQEFRTSPTIVNPRGLPAAYQDRGDATELLYLGRRSIAVSLRAKGHSRRGAISEPASGNERKMTESGCAPAPSSICRSRAAMPSGRVAINRTRTVAMATADWITAAKTESAMMQRQLNILLCQ